MTKISTISPLEDGTSDPRDITKKDLQVLHKELERWKQEFEEDEASNNRFHNPDFWKDLKETLKPFSDYKMILFRGFLSIISTLPKAKYFASDPYCRENSDTVAQSTSSTGSSTACPIGIPPSSCGGGQLHNPEEFVISMPEPSGLAATHPETGVASTVVDNGSPPSEAEANPDENRSPSEANPDENRSPSEANHEFDLEKKIILVVTIISCLGAINKSISEMSRNDKILVYCFLGCLLTLLASGSYGFLLARFKGTRINVIARFLMRVACAAAGAALIVVVGMWLPNDENKLLVTGLVCCVFLPALALGMMK